MRAGVMYCAWVPTTGKPNISELGGIIDSRGMPISRASTCETVSIQA
jgi:hypothetical protein